MVLKIQHLVKIFPTFGRLSELISQSVVRVLPFFAFFLVWTFLFAIELFVLRSNREDVEGYTGTSMAVGYFLLAFENGIGNISPPSVEEWYKEKHEDW